MHEVIQMKMTRYSEHQIRAILGQAESGVPMVELCREHGMCNALFYKWRAKYGGMDASMVSQMKAMAACPVTAFAMGYSVGLRVLLQLWYGLLERPDRHMRTSHFDFTHQGRYCNERPNASAPPYRS
jgi:transposase